MPLHNAHVRLYFRWNHFWAEETRRYMAMLWWCHLDNLEHESEKALNGASREQNQPVCTISR